MDMDICVKVRVSFRLNRDDDDDGGGMAGVHMFMEIVADTYVHTRIHASTHARTHVDCGCGCLLLAVLDCHLNLDARLNGDARDLLHDISGAEEIDEPLVDTQLVAIPRVGTLTTWRLARRQVQGLCRHTHRALHLHTQTIIYYYCARVLCMTWKGIDSTDEEPITMMSVMKDEYIYICVCVCAREYISNAKHCFSISSFGQGLLLLRWRHTYT